MPLVVAEDRLFAAPGEGNRPSQLPGGQREKVLDREVLAAAERAADRRVADDDLLLQQAEDLGDLAAILVQPLAGGLDHHAAGIVYVGDARLRLQERVLLPARLELAVDDDVSRPQRRGRVAFADARVLEQIRAVRGMDHRRIGCERRRRVEHRRQILVRDPHEPRAGFGGLVRLGHDERDAVADEAHDVTTEDGLVRLDQAVSVARHVGRREHGDDAGHGHRPGGIDRPDARVRPPRGNDREPQHAGTDEVARVACRARHLAERVGPGWGRADHAFNTASRILR